MQQQLIGQGNLQASAIQDLRLQLDRGSAELQTFATRALDEDRQYRAEQSQMLHAYGESENHQSLLHRNVQRLHRQEQDINADCATSVTDRRRLSNEIDDCKLHETQLEEHFVQSTIDRDHLHQGRYSDLQESATTCAAEYAIALKDEYSLQVNYGMTNDDEVWYSNQVDLMTQDRDNWEALAQEKTTAMTELLATKSADNKPEPAAALDSAVNLDSNGGAWARTNQTTLRGSQLSLPGYGGVGLSMRALAADKKQQPAGTKSSSLQTVCSTFPPPATIASVVAPAFLGREQNLLF